MSEQSGFNSLVASEMLEDLAREAGLTICSRKFAKYLDEKDQLAQFRDKFHIPNVATLSGVRKDLVNGEECIYLSGNSLGLQPKSAQANIAKIVENWKENGVCSYFCGPLEGSKCDQFVVKEMAELVGAKVNEVAVMNALSVNLHLLLISFYRPTQGRHKILLESRAFPSDHYVVESQIEQRGYKISDSLLLVDPDQESCIWNMDDIVATIDEHGDSIALVLLPGVQYYNGQVFDMERITKAAHEHGCMVGFDLAHAAGNIELRLHDWGVDFAAWCSYKYLNSGPGSIGVAFLHEKHTHNTFPKFTAWWSHEEATRFKMTNVMNLTPGISGYRISNPSPLLVACVKASLDIFKQTSMKKLREKSVLLTGYLEYLVKYYFKRTSSSDQWIDIITPARERGCQLSLKFSKPATQVYEYLTERGVCCDIREPDVIRVAPVPLYNNFLDVYRFVEILQDVV